MPAPVQSYDVVIDFTNDTVDCVSIQLLREYGLDTGTIVLLHPSEAITLILESGVVYRYALKTRVNVVAIV